MRVVAGLGTVGLQAALLVSMAGLAHAQAPPRWAEEHLAAWYKAFNAGDAKAVAALYSADAVVVPVGKPAVRGRAAIEAWQSQIHSETRFACSGAFTGVRAVGVTAIAWGQEDCQETARAGGGSRATKSQWVTVYERQADGKWLIVRDAGEAVGP